MSISISFIDVIVAMDSIKMNIQEIWAAIVSAVIDQPVVTVATVILSIGMATLVFRMKSSYTNSSWASDSKVGRSRTSGISAEKRVKRGYTRAEVAAHNKEGDCWLIVQLQGSQKPGVFDITEYADQHPGGDAIFAHAGGDATEGFYGPQHPPTVVDLITEYEIGWLADEK